MSSCSTPPTAAGSLRATSGRSPCRSTSPSNSSAPTRTSWNSARPTAERRHAARQRSTLDPLPCKLQVALREREKNKVWLWRAYDPVARRTLAWELGGRDDATCRRLLDKVGIEGRVFLTDDWEGFHRLIPRAVQFSDIGWP